MTSDILSFRLSRIKPSPTLLMTSEALRLKSEGVDVLTLSAGEPDFDTPDFIKDAAFAAIKAGMTKYTSVMGIAPLRKAVADKFKRDYDADISPDNVIIGCGAKHILFNCLLASLDAGDEVLIPSPYWVSYPDMVLLCGGVPVILPSAPDFKLTTDALRAHITEKSKWLILNSPNNPSGAVYSKDELRALLEVVREFKQLHILADDIYEKLIYDDVDNNVSFATPLGLAPEMAARIVTVNGVSKAYAMTGWRIGYAVADEVMIKAMAKIQSQSTSNACSVSQYAALAALQGSHDFLHEWRRIFKRRRDFIVNALNDIKGVRCAVPQGAFYVFASCQGVMGKKDGEGAVISSGEEYAAYLLRQAHVAVVAGEAFGVPQHFRLSYATSDAILQEACQRIKKATEALVN